MKHFRKLFLFCATIALSLSFAIVLFGCNGNGKKPGGGNKPDNPNIPNNPIPNGKVTLKFDSKKIYVVGMSGKLSGIRITNGREVEVGTKIAIDITYNALSEDEVLEGFKVGKRNEKIGKGESYTVTLEDSKQENGKNVIEITIEKRAKVKDKVKIIFEQNVRAVLVVHGRPQAVSSGESFEEGTEVIFEAKLSKDKSLDSWFINDAPKASSSQNDRLSYAINVNDAKDEAGNKVIRVRFTEKEAKNITLQFDEATIESIYTQSDYNHQTLAQNTIVKSGTVIGIFPKREKYQEGKTVDYFTINDNKTDAVNDIFRPSYKINEKDAKAEGDKLIIKIGAVFRDAKKATLQFDESIIRVIGTDGSSPPGGSGSIEHKNGDKVLETGWLLLKLKDGENKTVEQWLCNGTEIERRGNEGGLLPLLYIDSNAGDNVVLNITVKMRDAVKPIIKFADPITCESGNNPSITSGSSVKEGTGLRFGAKMIAGKVYENWLVNGKVKEKFQDGQWFYYKVNKDDAVNGVIEVTIASHDPLKVKVVLEKDTIKAEFRNQGAPQDLQNGGIVTEGDGLTFRLKHATEEGKVVDKWLVNGKEFKGDGNHNYVESNRKGMHLRLSKEYIVAEGSENVIKVSYEAREAKEIKIEFDSSKLECKTRNNLDEEVSVNNGQKLKEGSSVEFNAKDNVFVAKWFFNDEHVRRYDNDQSCRVYGIFKEDAIEKGGELVIKVSVEERQPVDIAIKFDEKKIDCKNAGTPVTSGAKVKEGTVLTLTTKDVPEGKTILWRYGTNNNWGKAGKPFNFKVSLSDVSQPDKNEMEITFEDN